MSAPTPIVPAGKFAIEVDGLQARYDERVILDSVSFAVKRGEIFFSR